MCVAALYFHISCCPQTVVQWCGVRVVYVAPQTLAAIPDLCTSKAII
jgi:hypothetical protein